MDVLGSLYLGFQVALAPANLLFCFVGVVIGTLVGVLPGIGPVGAMALLLPATYGTSLTSSLIMRQIFQTEITHIWPTVKDYAQVKWAIIRGTVLGFAPGILPGGGAVLASFLSYGIEKKLSKEPQRFGHGEIEGLAGPETANNATAAGSLIPLLSLGIPPNVVMAMLFSAMVIHGMQPGSLLMKTQPDLFWGLVASMYLGNVLLVLPLIGVWVQLLKIPYRILMPLILLFCLIGSYSLNNSTFDVSLMVLFGGVGYMMRKYGYEAAPLVLAFIMGPLLENNLRQSLLMSHGSFLIFVSRPISAMGLATAFFLLLANLIPFLKKRREKVGEILKEQ
jgi:putative tricarboxylic transport membrane protein